MIASNKIRVLFVRKKLREIHIGKVNGTKSWRGDAGELARIYY